nr:MAG: capsid protein [Cressdnaviricota sp.]
MSSTQLTAAMAKVDKARRKSRFYNRSKAARTTTVTQYRGNVSPRDLDVPMVDLQTVRSAPYFAHGYPGAGGPMSAEFKAISRAMSDTVDSTGTIACMNGTTMGSDLSNRVGRQIEMRSIEMKVYMNVISGTGVDQEMRCLLVYDRQTNGVSATITDILDTNNCQSLRNLDNRKRFKILMDKRFTFEASGQNPSHCVWDYYRKLRHPVQYNSGNAGTVADIASGALYIIFFGDKVAGVTSGHEETKLRIRFTDV